VIRDSSKLAIFYSYKICKQCKWTYSLNLHSFNIRINSLVERFLTKSKDANHHESRIVWSHHNILEMLWDQFFLSNHMLLIGIRNVCRDFLSGLIRINRVSRSHIVLVLLIYDGTRMSRESRLCTPRLSIRQDFF